MFLKFFTASPIDIVVLKFREIYPMGNRPNGALFTWQTNNKISPASQTVATERFAPKICHGQPPTMYSECCRFHPNRFTFGGVIAKRVKTVFPVSYASLRANDNVNTTTLLPMPTESRVEVLFPFVCKSVCFSERYLKKYHQTMHKCSENPFILGIKKSKIKITSHKTSPAWIFALLWVLAYLVYKLRP